MRAHTRLRGPDGTRYELVHGDLIGRLWTAAMPLDDARLSEAHAMVSLREQELKLIALRGSFGVEGKPLNEVCLRPGMEILLARGLAIEVEDVVLPAHVLGIETRRLPRQALLSVCSVFCEPMHRVVAGYAEGADAWIWYTGEHWRLRLPDQAARVVTAGDTAEVRSERLAFVEIPLAAAGQAATRTQGAFGVPLRITANFDTVHIYRDQNTPLVLGGVHARIVSELVALGGPTHWTVLAGLIWPREPDPEAVRSRLDVNLSRLRRKLREARIRTDLVHTDGAGCIEILLYPQDVVEDRT